MEETMMVRLQPYNPRAGRVRKRFGFAGIVFEAGTGWYAVDRDVAEHLGGVRQRDGDEHSAPAFDVATEEEARKLDDREQIKAKAQRPVDEAKIVDARRSAPPPKQATAPDSQPTPPAPQKPAPKAKKA